MLPDRSVEVNQRIAHFRGDLLKYDATSIVREHVIFGNCFLLNAANLYKLKAQIAHKFRVHPSEVVMVGSAQMGFSIMETKRYRPFGEESDLDLAIVAPTLFDSVWEEVYEYSREGAFWPEAGRFKDYLFRGWIRPDKLPPSQIFPLRNDWFEFFRELTNSGEFGTYKISAALYKSWKFLEDYQERNVNACQRNEAREL